MPSSSIVKKEIFRLILKELGHPQSATPVHCDNKTAVGIANNTIKRQRSRSMEMRYFWVADQATQGNYSIQWYPGQENLGDYQSKHHIGMHHSTVRPWYLHQANSPMVLPRALAPAALRGCLGTLPKGYTRGAPLPKVPSYRAQKQPLRKKQVHLPRTPISRIGARLAAAQCALPRGGYPAQ